jgi:hypothetical protein
VAWKISTRCEGETTTSPLAWVIEEGEGIGVDIARNGFAVDIIGVTDWVHKYRPRRLEP